MGLPLVIITVGSFLALLPTLGNCLHLLDCLHCFQYRNLSFLITSCWGCCSGGSGGGSCSGSCGCSCKSGSGCSNCCIPWWRAGVKIWHLLIQPISKVGNLC